jgi:branched-chain amino acid transport system ATP-binding protein
MLTLQDVAVSFGALRAVNGVSLQVGAGERRAIIGPNGAGKTTLFQAITGMVPATEGRVRFLDKDVTRLPPHRRARLGMARTFQITNLFPTEEEERRAESALAAAHLTGRAEVAVADLSYGEQRQVELALSIANRPRLLLLDEPAAGLSPTERAMVAEIIRGLSREITLVLIEHDMDLVLGLVDRVTCLHEGQVLVECAPAEISSNAAVQEVYLGRPRGRMAHAGG